MEYIYVIENLVNHRKYVGRTSKFQNRIKLHRNNLLANRHPNKLLQEDFNKYGMDNFKVDILEESESFGRTSAEKDWILKLKTYDTRYGYNQKDPIVWCRYGCFTKNIPEEEHEILYKQLGVSVEELTNGIE